MQRHGHGHGLVKITKRILSWNVEFLVLQPLHHVYFHLQCCQISKQVSECSGDDVGEEEKTNGGRSRGKRDGQG